MKKIKVKICKGGVKNLQAKNKKIEGNVRKFLRKHNETRGRSVITRGNLTEILSKNCNIFE